MFRINKDYRLAAMAEGGKEARQHFGLLEGMGHSEGCKVLLVGGMLQLEKGMLPAGEGMLV